jgi:hypothetical protein
MSYPVYYQGSIGISPRLTIDDAELLTALGDPKPNPEADELLDAMQATSKATVRWYAGLLRIGRMHGSISPHAEESSHGLGLWLKLLIDHFFAPRGYVLHGEVSWKAVNNAADRGSIFVKNNRIEVIDDVILNPGPSWKRTTFADAELKEAIQTLIDSADDTGCTEDLTVVSASAVEALRKRTTLL